MVAVTCLLGAERECALVALVPIIPLLRAARDWKLGSWVLVPPLLLTYVALGKSLCISLPQFPLLLNGGITLTQLTGELLILCISLHSAYQRE